MRATTLLLVRHGDVEGIDPERFRGRHDLPLTPLGRRQADAAAKRIAAGWKPSALYTSPLRRCVETGAAVAAATKLKPERLDALTDFDFGTWTWQTHDEVRKASPRLFKLWRRAPQLVRVPGGEAIQDVVARSADALRLVLERHAGKTVVAVTHDNVIRCLLVQLLDMPLSAYATVVLAPCSISEVAVEGARVHVLRVNDAG